MGVRARAGAPSAVVATPGLVAWPPASSGCALGTARAPRLAPRDPATPRGRLERPATPRGHGPPGCTPSFERRYVVSRQAVDRWLREDFGIHAHPPANKESYTPEQMAKRLQHAVSGCTRIRNFSGSSERCALDECYGSQDPQLCS